MKTEKKIKYKMFIVLIILMLLINIASPVFGALSMGEVTHIYGERTLQAVVQIKASGLLKSVVKVYYIDPDTKQHMPAFCVEPDDIGVGSGATGMEGYDTYIKETLSDAAIWRILAHGYIGKKWNTTSVENDDDWYITTKVAIHAFVNKKRPTEAYEIPDHVAPSDKISLTDAKRRGALVLAEADKLYDYAINHTEDTYEKASVNIQKTGSLTESGNYLVQNYKISANKELGNYDVTLSGFPEGTTYNKSGNNVSVKILKENIKDDIEGTINISNAEVKTFPAFYAKSYKDSWQDYIVTADPYETASARANLNLDANNAKIEILKVDEETDTPIPDTTFEISKDGEILTQVTTGSNGKAVLDSLYPGTYDIKETKANENYIPSTKVTKVQLEYGQTAKITLENTRKKGNLKLIKVDKDNPNITLGSVAFDLYSEELDKVIGTYYTDANGEILVENLRVGNYKWIEKNTNKWYTYNTNDLEIKVEWNETTENIVQNELKKGQIKVVKVDKENKEIKLKDVEFDVLDKDGNVLETIKTDENGVAITKKYALRDYENLTLKEVKSHEGYVLDDTIQVIELKENETTNITISNEKIKGQIQITKISSDDNNLTGEEKGSKLEGAKFEIYSEDNKLVDTVITDENGIGTSKLLEYGKYYIKEVDTGSSNYLLNTKTYMVEIKENLKVVSIVVENESVDIGVDIDKSGVETASANEEIKYSFDTLKNTSNVPLDNFTWIDNLPYEYVRLTKLYTGTYNEDLDYVVKYKTNKTKDYIVFGTYNSQENNEIDFTKLKLQKNEYITDFKIEFGTVMPGFEAVEKPYIYTKVLETVKQGDKWTNYTTLKGNYNENKTCDKANWTTITPIKKLPRTGF